MKNRVAAFFMQKGMCGVMLREKEREFGAFKPISDASPKYVLSFL